MNFAAQLVAWLNVAANALGKLLLAPIALLPGWLSITVVSAFLGLACLIVFKYTSRPAGRDAQSATTSRPTCWS